mmetsp:Transcript_18886/g.53835  ORF Transcript_18886/g.53835 Transcript_18886/m.53835 type:complete len:201 (+) Transcript_18886:903-1505(+)
MAPDCCGRFHLVQKSLHSVFVRPFPTNASSAGSASNVSSMCFFFGALSLANAATASATLASTVSPFESQPRAARASSASTCASSSASSSAPTGFPSSTTNSMGRASPRVISTSFFSGFSRGATSLGGGSWSAAPDGSGVSPSRCFFHGWDAAVSDARFALLLVGESGGLISAMASRRAPVSARLAHNGFERSAVVGRRGA